jgi:hypothetical protein
MKAPDYEDLPYEVLAVKEGVVLDVVSRHTLESEATHRFDGYARSIANPGFKAVLTFNGKTIRES